VLWFRYEQHTTLHHTGQQAQAELALDDCKQGRYDASVQQLEKMLRRGQVPIPPE
jgi:cytochrome c-type biogenesis protein CcmH/NrfG